MALTLTAAERAELERRLRSLKIRAEDARRARVILMLADGASYSTIEATVPVLSATTSTAGGERFLARAPRRAAAAVSRPTADRADAGDGGAHAGRRRVTRRPTAARTGARASSVGCSRFITTSSAKAWRRAGLQPHRFERYMQSDDPDFETKAADVIGLYVNPPDHAAVFAVDEKTAIQALDRLDPVLPLSPAVPNATASSTTGMARCRCSPRSTRNPAKCSARPCRGTPARRSSSSSATSWAVNRRAANPRHRGQSVDAQDAGGPDLPAGPSARPSPLHPDVFVVAQPSGTLVCQDRTGPARAWRLHVRSRPRAQDSALHPPLQQGGETGPVELSQSGASN